MKKYFSFFRIRFLAGLQYRAAAWAGIVTQFAWGGMSLLMYHAFYKSGQNAFPMEFSQLSCYIWMQQAFLAMFMVWFYDNEIFDHITSGSIAYELCRPCDLYSMWFIKNMAIRLSRVVLRCVPILLVAALLPDPFGLRLPVSWSAALLFPLSMALGFLVMVAFTMLVYISAFYTISANGVRILVTSVLEFLTGGVLPIPFFPGLAPACDVRAALRLNAKYAVPDLRGPFFPGRRIEEYVFTGFLADCSGADRQRVDEPGREKSCGAGRLSE